MYNEAHYNGDIVRQYRVFGTLPDGTRVAILPEHVGVTIFQFDGYFIEALRLSDVEQIKFYVELFQTRQQKELTHVYLEEYPWVISEEGSRQLPSQIVAEYRVADL